MKIAFRVDASTQMGAGHLMRCRTLALALRKRGHDIRFVCRPLQGHLMSLLIEDGFSVQSLPPIAHEFNSLDSHQNWLGVTPDQDAEDTSRVLRGWQADWLLVDHYGLGRAWELSLRSHVQRILVIDDLANRHHDCDVLLDQNLVEGRAQAYASLLPDRCSVRLGPPFALVRPEFMAQRAASLARRNPPKRARLLIFMGGSDPDDDTRTVLEGVQRARRHWAHVDVVVGAGYPALTELRPIAEAQPQVQLHVQTPHMATIMAMADLAVTAGGTVSWEKCVLGLPSLVAITGDNQAPIAHSLHRAHAQITLGVASTLSVRDYAAALDTIELAELAHMSAQASAVCDGRGVERIISVMESN